MRNFLIGGPGGVIGFDLAVLNIQRGRDHGLLRYNATRGAYGLEMFTDWDDPDLPIDEAVRQALRSVYLTIDDVGLWVGGLSERHDGESMLGELLTAILRDQFGRVRDGDRFWHENDIFEPAWVDMIEGLTLGHIIELNTGMDSMPQFAFLAVEVPEPGAAWLLALGLALTITGTQYLI